jgi:F-type H+-transporting ATPase subunit b
MELDATFWAMISLFIFLGVIVRLKVPGRISQTLNGRADRIRAELEEARKLREEAQVLLAEYQRKRRAAEAEAAEIVAQAKHDAEQLGAESARKMEEFVARRTAMAEQKISQAEAQALAEVKARAVDVAVAAAERIVAGKLSGAQADSLIDSSIAELRRRMN